MTDPSIERMVAAAAEARRIDAGEAPTELDLADAPLISQWKLAEDPNGMPCLVGIVAGHPRLRMGYLVATSALLRADLDAGWARTISRYYRLGPKHGESEQ